MPYCVSKIHCQITVLVSAGIDHASISPSIVNNRIFLPSRSSRSATAIPSVIVNTTFTAQNTIVRRSTAQNSGSCKMSLKLSKADPVGRGAELLLEAELLQRQRQQPHDRIAEHQHQRGGRRHQ